LYCNTTATMPQKYPVGLQDFDKIRTQNYVYVDKTKYVWQLAEDGGYYFLSRPRRFGKSLFVTTMDYLFKGRKELFEGLYIADKWDWSKTNPVIKISFSNIGHKTMGLVESIDAMLNDTAAHYEVSFVKKEIDQKFKELIEKLSVKLGKVVVLIDEYDKPIIDYLGEDTQKAIENRNILKSFYSILKDADPFLKMVFITGVSKFSKVSIFSDLNNLKDISIDTNFESICGINQAELDQQFTEELTIYDPQQIKKWYNGYSWGGKDKVYNPFSLLSFFSGDGQFKSYWFETGTPTFLIGLSKNQQIYDFENAKISAIQLSTYDLERLQILPLMFQTGYLTIKSYDIAAGIYTLNYPNEEVRQSYLEMLIDNYQRSDMDSGRVLADKLRNILASGNLEPLQRLINAIFKSIPYEIWQRENEHYYHALIHLTFRLLGIYVESQVQTSDGRIDALVQIKDYIYAFEFKLDGSSKAALEQIKEKNYLQPYFHQNKTCIGVGINFSTETKKVESLIWEEIGG
jgi:Predicted AAA-ATPase/PD-(D/E)XK nuclease superfamily